jgi:hypothetical protein
MWDNTEFWQFFHIWGNFSHRRHLLILQLLHSHALPHWQKCDTSLVPATAWMDRADWGSCKFLFCLYECLGLSGLVWSLSTCLQHTRSVVLCEILHPHHSLDSLLWPYYDVTIVSFRSPYIFYLLTTGVEVLFLFHLITLGHTPQSLGLLWPRDRPVAETSTWQRKHSQETADIHAPRAGFEPTIRANVRPQTYALDREATGMSPSHGLYF